MAADPVETPGSQLREGMAPVSGPVRRRGLMLVLSSPSGAGKTSIARGLIEQEPGLVMSVSVTTRPPRPVEREGIDYIFIDRERYRAMVEAGDLLEHAEVYGHGYGTPKAAVDARLESGGDVLFDIDWQGAQQLREARGGDMVSIFILPPSRQELERRLRTRAQDPEEVVRRRLSQVAADVTHWAEYDYVLVNHDLGVSTAAARSILAAERLRRKRQTGLGEFVAQYRDEA